LNPNTPLHVPSGAQEFLTYECFLSKSSYWHRIAVAAPISWLYSQYWLSDYAYHIEIGITPFAIAGTSALTVALLTVGYSTIRAAGAKPVDLLKHQ